MLVGDTPADDLLYCTAAFRAMMSAPLRAQFRNLDELILDVACSAVERLIVVSPYLGTGVIAALRPAVAVSAERGAWIRLVTDVDEAGGANKRALAALVQDEDGQAVRRRLRVLSASGSLRSLLHAKILIADGQRGYLGSANLSGRGFDENVEVGIALRPNQAKALDEMIALFESSGVLQDRTDAVLGRSV